MSVTRTPEKLTLQTTSDLHKACDRWTTILTHVDLLHATHADDQHRIKQQLTSEDEIAKTRNGFLQIQRNHKEESREVEGTFANRTARFISDSLLELRLLPQADLNPEEKFKQLDGMHTKMKALVDARREADDKGTAKHDKPLPVSLFGEQLTLTGLGIDPAKLRPRAGR